MGCFAKLSMLRVCCLISACFVALPVAASVSVQESLEMDAERYRQAAHEAMSRVVQREVARAHEEERRSKNAGFDLMSAAELAAYHRCIDFMLTMDEAMRVLALLYEHGSPFLRPDAEAARFWRARYESCQPQS